MNTVNSKHKIEFPEKKINYLKILSGLKSHIFLLTQSNVQAPVVVATLRIQITPVSLIARTPA